jgi:hypothetical protein
MRSLPVLVPYFLVLCHKKQEIWFCPCGFVALFENFFGCGYAALASETIL